MAGFDNDVVYADNVDFSGGSPVSGKILLDGQLLIGSTALNAGGTHINVGTLTAGTGIAITNGSGSIIIENTGGGGGGGGTNSLMGNSGTATQSGGVITVIGSSGITTTGDGASTLTITPTNDLAALEALAGTGYAVRTGVDTWALRTFLAGSGISLSNADGVAGATTITAGATVPTTFTGDAGSASPALNNINIFGTAVQGISTSAAGSTVTITAADATDTQKGVASFDLTNFTVTAGDVASNPITITAGVGLDTGGAVNLGGAVTLDLEVPVIVANGGTGRITLTDNGVLYGDITSPVGMTAAGTNGQVLIAATGAPPAFATIAGTQGVTLTGGANTLSIGLVNVPNSALLNSSITITAGAGISVVGSPVSLGGVVTISATGTIVTQFSADSGVAVPAGNNINLLGTSAQGLSTSATGATVTFTNANATTTQKGVVALATNAEAIAGTDTAKAITADDLKAKLGAQTSHGFAIGAGTTSAIAWTAEPSNGQLPIGSTGNAPVLSTLTAGTGISITNGAGSITIANTSSSGTPTKITKFTASGTWTKATSPSPIVIQIYAWAGGGGGGSGRKGQANAGRRGGAGGAGGQFLSTFTDASYLGVSEIVTIGAGGAGAPAQTDSLTDGLFGTAGGDTSLGSLFVAYGGNPGRGGSQSSSNPGGLSRPVITPYISTSTSQSDGGSTGSTGNNGGSVTASPLPTGGGSGGGMDSSNTQIDGGRGGNIYLADGSTIIRAGGAFGPAGVGDAGDGTNASSSDDYILGGTGGGGGGGVTAAQGDGGDAGTPGAGGGGGSGSGPTYESGAGGDGGRGELWVIEYF